jgi:hypothetical protein
MLDLTLRMPLSQGSSTPTLVTAKDLPIEVQCLLKSYDLASLQWESARVRHTIIVQILTRGNEDAERWLWATLTREEVRHLLRQFGGAGADNEGRVMLREKTGLTEEELPPRPFGSLPWRG